VSTGRRQKNEGRKKNKTTVLKGMAIMTNRLVFFMISPYTLIFARAPNPENDEINLPRYAVIVNIVMAQ
jgi:hypothetical protein